VSQRWELWEPAWQRALYGPGGFYRRPEGPAGHFRTAAHAAPIALAAALRTLARQAGCTAIVDVGAGRGELLTALAGPGPGPGPRRGPGDGLRLWGGDVVQRPTGLPAPIGWSTGIEELPDHALAGALVIAWELLDVVPCPVLELDERSEPRLVLLDPRSGSERLGPRPPPADLAWCGRWWPPGGLEPGSRIEVGTPRDALWSALVRRAAAAGARMVLAVDYAHLAAARPGAGSLTGFRAGRAVPPRPDSSMDITAHVAIDAVAEAGRAAGATATRLGRQSEALAALGVRDAELLDPGGLGGFSWLEQDLR
jgi:SAM-dependent MidA family methyltransferase